MSDVEVFPEPLMTYLNEARKEGEQAGKNAAGWFVTSSMSQDAYKRILDGINDGDPEILQELPVCDLSGEWADGMTPAKVYELAGVEDPDSLSPEDLDEIVSTYETSFDQAAHDEVGRVCRYHLEDGR